MSSTPATITLLFDRLSDGDSRRGLARGLARRLAYAPANDSDTMQAGTEERTPRD